MTENETVPVEGTQEKKKVGRPPILPDEDFEKVWNAANNLDEVVNVLFPGLTGDDLDKRKTYCSLRASRMRKKVPELKVFATNRKRKVAELSGTPTEENPS